MKAPLVRLGEVCEIIPGQSPDGATYNPDGRGIPFYQGKREFTDRLLGSPSVWTTAPTRIARAGDLLMSVRAPVGPVNQLDREVCIGRGLAAVRPNESLDSNFLYWVLESMQDRIRGQEGAVFPSINRAQIGALEIPLPPIGEQKQIAAKLDAIDDRIRGMTAALAGLRRRQSTLLRSVFASEFTSGENPTVTLSNVCQVKNGATPKTGIASFWDGEVNWITPAEMGSLDTPYVEATRRTLTTEGLASCSATLSPAYSVILSCRAPIGYVVINTVPMATNQGCKTLIPTEDVHYKYLYHFLAANTELLNGLGTGATFPEISARALKQVEIPLPPVAEQVRIAKKLDDFTEATQRLDTSLAKQMSAARQLQVAALHSFLEGGK